MRYKIFVLIIFSLVSSQSLYNRFLGADSFSGSARSTAMGNTHLLNSTNSYNVRFNPAMLSARNNGVGIDFQVKRFSSFERWSMPVRDSFDEVLTHADYVSNEFSKFLVSGGTTMSLKLPFIGSLGVGFSHYPLTHFTYAFSEEVRGTYRPDDGEYASKDPIVGYQNYNVDGTVMASSVGVGATLNLLGDFKTSVGASFSLTQPFTLDERVEIDTLYSDVTNLSVYPDIDDSYKIDSDFFVSASVQIDLTASSVVGLFYESELQLKTDSYNITIDSTNGLFQYWDEDEYLPMGLNYLKPQLIGFSWGYQTTTEQPLSINFEINQLSYNNHLNLDDFYTWKFGFEYITQLNTPVRGGLVYSTSPLKSIPASTMFTFGTGKRIGNLLLDISGTYQLFTYKYPDLFVVTDDVRPDYYDTIRDSQLNLFFAVSYSF
ncbi:MAG: hypothetical protein H8E72_01330 [Candidatus Marinimicrobia bacterium]|nr:hypothetical protein [Candidatus Neomarinimicrobiota bacterium]